MNDSQLIALLRRDGEPLAVGGNEPFRLDTDRAVWLIEAGKVEIFAVRTDVEGGSPRTHLATTVAGQMLFSIDSRAESVPFGFGAKPKERSAALLAVGLPGTRLLKVGTATLRELAREPEHVPELAAAIEDWLAALFSRIPRPSAPKHFQELRPGAETELAEQGLVARPGDGVAWVRTLEGCSHFLGCPELAVKPTGYLLPIFEKAWLVSGEQTSVSCVETGMLLRSGGVWEGLARFHELFLDYVGLQIAATAERECSRLGRKLELDHQTLQEAYARLASVLGPSAHGEFEISERAEPLLAACQLVAESQGLTVRPPPEPVGAAKPGYHLSRICAASRIRHRRLILRDDWWRRDSGPLVGFLAAEEDGEEQQEKRRKKTRPVALLPTSPQSYESVDPGEKTRTVVDEALAERFAGEAYMLYPPLPERPLTRWDLLRAALRGRRRDLVTILLMGAGGGVLGVLVPILTGHLFGNVIPRADRSQLFQMTLALIVSALAAAAFQITRSIAVLRLGGKMDGSLQAAVWDRLLSLPATFFRRFTVGDLTNRSMGIDAIRNLLIGNVTTSMLAAVFSLFSFALLFYYSWQLALVATLLVAVLLAVTTFLAYLQLRHQRELLRLQGRISSMVFGLIHGVAKLRVAGAEPRAFALWAERFTEQRQRTLRAQRTANVQTAFNAVYAVITSLTVFAMVVLSSGVDLPVSRFLAFNAAFGQFQAAALSIIALVSGMLTMVPIYERLQPILEAVPEVDETKAAAGELAGDVEFSHISFHYQADGPLILGDVSFRARPGEFIALVGPSGSGKSTTLRLLLGFEQPDSGSIYFDGQDLPSLDVQSVRRQIGVVLQHGKPMAGDIFTNIVGSANLTIDDAWEAARMAGLEEDIKKMPMGMHTVISEGAGTFSGGQVQRLMIARAIVNRPRILLFDEATSALDNRTQEIVSRSLERLKATRIIVAHRLSTIRNADRIFVIEAGRVVESGSYEELVAQEGLFARLAARQIA
ncbi:MAG: NHLP bacteriocin export ABC transporter permease/ATPase subunit [bacterium]|nr:NHLP bacteriocin export ABC transporter permease/ATPase subunit [bacterium]